MTRVYFDLVQLSSLPRCLYYVRSRLLSYISKKTYFELITVSAGFILVSLQDMNQSFFLFHSFIITSIIIFGEIKFDMDICLFIITRMI